MSDLSDRYSCHTHGKEVADDCVACEVYGDITKLCKRIAELHEQLAAAQSQEVCTQPHADPFGECPWCERDRLRAALECADTALKFYGQHTQNCTVRVYRDIAEIELEVRPTCSCNYSARVAEIAKALEAGDD